MDGVSSGMQRPIAEGAQRLDMRLVFSLFDFFLQYLSYAFLLPLQIINGMLHTDSKTNCFFRGLTISEEEWNAVREVNKVLEVGFFYICDSDCVSS